MKRYFLTVLTAAASLLFAVSCGNENSTDQAETDTSVNSLPAESAPMPPETTPARPGDTLTPRIDPAMDSAARQGTMPPK